MFLSTCFCGGYILDTPTIENMIFLSSALGAAICCRSVVNVDGNYFFFLGAHLVGYSQRIFPSMMLRSLPRLSCLRIADT